MSEPERSFDVLVEAMRSATEAIANTHPAPDSPEGHLVVNMRAALANWDAAADEEPHRG